VYTPERGSAIGRIVLECRVVHILDVLDDPEYSLTALQKAGGYRTVLGVPMLREGVPIGAIAVARNEVRPFSEAEIRLIETFADYVVIAIENVRLFQTVEQQRTELARFAPQVANLLSSDDVGELVIAYQGTVEHFAGDGLMAFFNDPTPIPEHELAAVRTAVAVRERFTTLAAEWRKRGYELGLGIGIATGYATLGRIGFEGRYDYGAIGNVAILASRLSDAAGPGEILLSQRAYAAVEDRVATEPVQDLRLKGWSRPVVAVRAIGVQD
jgi:class 3 adenylate cyclase